MFEKCIFRLDRAVCIMLDIAQCLWVFIPDNGTYFVTDDCGCCTHRGSFYSPSILCGIRTSIYIIVHGWGFVKGSGIGLCRMTRKFVGKFLGVWLVS